MPFKAKGIANMERDCSKIPIEWIERIFERMEQIYGDKWISHIGKHDRQRILKSIWSVALTGCNGHEIKRAIDICEAFPYSGIPTHVEFYHYAKGIRKPGHMRPPIESKGSYEVAKKYLDQIKNKLIIKGST
jgi:hypothetical protein